MGVDAGHFLREWFVYILDITRKRWPLFVAPVLAASVLAFGAVKMAPTKYTASSLIMLQAANRTPSGLGSGHHMSTFEQVQAVEAWLKSDQVLAELVPLMTGNEPAKTPIETMVAMRVLAASLSLEVVGNSVLQIKMEGKSPEGLGRNLEIILARLMEGLTGPEQNVFSATQFVELQRTEAASSAEAELMRAIEDSGSETPLQVRTDLANLWTLTRQGQRGDLAEVADRQTNTDRLRQRIGTDPAKIAQLENLYATYRTAADKQAEFSASAAASRRNYVSIFNSPDDILIVGRPKDPIVGESSARKIAIAGILFCAIIGVGLALLAELATGVLRTRQEYETATGLPVLARIPKLPS